MTQLTASNLTKKFAGMTAVNDVSVTLEPGEVLGLIGPNGAGKTTLFNLITGQLKPTSGEVYVGDQRITDRSVHARVSMGLGRTFQIMRPLVGLTVLENVMMGAFLRHRRRNIARDRAREILQTVGLEHEAGIRAGNLSLPHRKRLEVARALATEPFALLLDEVMAGLNPADTDNAIELFAALRSSGLALLLIEHNLKVVRDLADSVIVLDHGQTISHGTPEDVLNDPAVVSAYIGQRR